MDERIMIHQHRPVFTPSYERPCFLRIDSAIFSMASSTQMRWMYVTDLEKGVKVKIRVKTVLGNEIEKNHLDHSYVGKCFSILALKPAADKRYDTYQISEIELQHEIHLTPTRSELPLTASKLSGRRRKMPTSNEYSSIQRAGTWNSWYSSYYLKSSTWKKVIKPRILERDKGLCVRCGGAADRVHHRNYEYEVMIGNADEQLASICEGCHNIVHEDDFAKKRSHAERDSIMKKRDFRIDFPPPRVDGRKSFLDQEHPLDWNRMNAVQRTAWDLECRRQWAFRKVRGERSESVAADRLFLKQYGFNEAEIAELVANPKKMPTAKNPSSKS